MFEIIAMITMFIDHLGTAFFPDQMEFRIIGRIAMPLYTFGIVQGYKYTKNFNKYILRLVILALVSQPFYSLLFHTKGLNMVFTLLVCLILLKYYDQTKSKSKYLIIPLAAYILEAIDFDYGFYAFLLTLIYYVGKKIVWRHNLLNIAYICINNWVIQLFSFLPSMLITKYENHPLRGRMRNFYRIFYPLHLAFLLLLDKII